MMRTQIQLTKEQHKKLQMAARQRNISLSEMIRRIINEKLGKEDDAPTRNELIQSALAVCGKYRDPEGKNDISTDHDAHLANAFEQ